MVRRNLVISHKTLFIIVTAEHTQDCVVSAADFLPDDYEACQLLSALMQQHTEHLAGYDMLVTLYADAWEAQNRSIRPLRLSRQGTGRSAPANLLWSMATSTRRSNT